MDDIISIEGVETHNLRGFDLTLKKKAINLIVGPSGSGKSSLAYDTVAEIGQHEFLAMFADDIAEPSYRVKNYRNMVASIPVKQINNNNNLRSTIGTYFGLNHSIIYIYASLLNLPESTFTLNKSENLCEECHGLGFNSLLDENRIIDYNIPLSENPVRCWNKYKDFYRQIILKYCDEQGIEASKTFRQLSSEEKKKILYGISTEKYSIKYKKGNRLASRTTQYYGIMTRKPMIVGFEPSPRFFSDRVCESCHGQKYAAVYSQYKLYGLSIGEFMTMNFVDLLPVITQILSKKGNSNIYYALLHIKNFISKAVELNLGHLFFHRAIPTLSGGEIQRLKMVQIFNSQLSDLLIVLDEPLAGLSGQDKKSVYENIVSLAQKHTLLIVDHSDIFVNEAEKVYALGPGSGVNGGEIIDAAKYLAEEAVPRPLSVFSSTSILKVQIANTIYQYKGVKMVIAANCMNLITGPSGIGKSTLLREYFPQAFSEYLYINQKALVGSKNSCVATALNLSKKISNLFAKKTGKDSRLFSNLTGNDGACPTCGGGGFVEYGYNEQTKLRLVCKECGGTGFNTIVKKYHINNKNICDIWQMTVDEGCDYFKLLDHQISDILQEASLIMLGHLCIGQAISTLSGGENIRLKLLRAFKSTSKVLGIDEPFKGLSPSEIYMVACFLDRIRSKGKTIVVVDHSEIAEQYFFKKIILQVKDSILTDAEWELQSN